MSKKQKCLSEHTKLDYSECYAKLILEYSFPQKYRNLLIEDKPDLYDSEHNVGIEVTMAIKQEVQEARKLWLTMSDKNIESQQWAKERMHQLGYEYQGSIQSWGSIIYEQGAASCVFDVVYNSIKLKLEKLNQNGLYKECEYYGLFIESELAFEQEWIDDFIQNIKKIYEEYEKKYAVIYFVAQNDIIEIDMERNEHSEIISFNEVQYEIAISARKMVENGEADERI